MITIGQLFKVTQGSAAPFESYYDVTDESIQNTCAHICGSTNRNGINGFVEPHEEDIVVQPLAITVCKKGDGGVSYATVQQVPFIALSYIFILEPLEEAFKQNDIKVDNDTLSTICAFIRKEKWRYSFGREFGESSLINMELNIPEIKRLAAMI